MALQMKKPLTFMVIILLVVGFLFFVSGQYVQLRTTEGGGGAVGPREGGTGDGGTGDGGEAEWNPNQNEAEEQQEQARKWNLNITFSLQVLGFALIIIAFAILIWRK